ncbi:MAG: hypothetical protein HRU49_07400 [Winogradskyella sp.]|uniref:hypothetical protein n=1 Tax=Winogradskyella sp. TaxID=1883156 RepID=UPI0025E031A5|nr:hypothetical protein [Winogradskyella sp.]NRB83584.1 hypothetical protein [Winogradskyella sp.]
MSQEEVNKEKRKTIPLTTSESLTFFFLPFSFFGPRNKKHNDFNKSELDRFEEYGFYLKIKQAKELTLYGKLFYIAITVIIIYLMKY